MSYTPETALILAQQREIETLRRENDVLRKTQCEHCRGKSLTLRDDAIFVGQLQLTRDGLFKTRISSPYETLIKFGKKHLTMEITESTGMSSSIQFNVAILSGQQYIDGWNFDRRFFDYDAVFEFREVDLCTHMFREWKRIFEEIRIKYISNT